MYRGIYTPGLGFLRIKYKSKVSNGFAGKKKKKERRKKEERKKQRKEKGRREEGWKRDLLWKGPIWTSTNYVCVLTQTFCFSMNSLFLSFFFLFSSSLPPNLSDTFFGHYYTYKPETWHVYTSIQGLLPFMSRNEDV